jgi:hypothetical protein
LRVLTSAKQTVAIKLFLLISFSFTNKAFGQNAMEIKIEIGRKGKITKVDVEGSFPNGEHGSQKD